jgi:hypothetical protein
MPVAAAAVDIQAAGTASATAATSNLLGCLSIRCHPLDLVLPDLNPPGVFPPLSNAQKANAVNDFSSPQLPWLPNVADHPPPG